MLATVVCVALAATPPQQRSGDAALVPAHGSHRHEAAADPLYLSYYLAAPWQRNKELGKGTLECIEPSSLDEMRTLSVNRVMLLQALVGVVSSAYMPTAAQPPQGRAMATAASRVSMRGGTDSRWERPARNRYGDDPRPCRRLQWRLPQIRRRLRSRCVTEQVMPPPGEVGRLSTVRQLSSVIAHEHVTTRRPGSGRERTVRRPELATHGSRRPRACAPLSSGKEASRALAPWSVGALRASAIAHPGAPAL